MSLTYRVVVLIWLLLVFSFNGHAQESNDPKAMYDRIKSLEAKSSRLTDDHYRDKTVLERVQSWGICPTDECKATDKLKSELEKELDKRAEVEPVAAFYAGLINLESAQFLNNSRMAAEAAKLIEHFSTVARRQFAFASSAGIAAASWNMGVIYATNLGVIGSKLAAIEWYGRAGHQYLKDGERETALAALEKMEAMDAKHPDSIRLREALYPTTKKK